MPEINLLPEELRKKEQEIQKENQGEQMNPKVVLRTPKEEITPEKTLSRAPLSPPLPPRPISVPPSPPSSPEPLKIPPPTTPSPKSKINFSKLLSRLSNILSIFKRPKKETIAPKISPTLAPFKEAPFTPQEQPFLEVNLLAQEIEKAKKLKATVRKLIISISALAVLIILFYITLVARESSIAKNIRDQEKEVTNIEKEIRELTPSSKEAESIDKTTKKVADLLNQHIYWTNFLNSLEKYTQPQVYYGGVETDLKGKFELSAFAKNLEDITLQLQTLQNATDFIKSIKLSEVKQRTETNPKTKEIKVFWEGNFIIEVNPQIFSK